PATAQRWPPAFAPRGGGRLSRRSEAAPIPTFPRKRGRSKARENWGGAATPAPPAAAWSRSAGCRRSEEHTSELQSRENLVCRLLLEKKNSNSTLQIIKSI